MAETLAAAHGRTGGGGASSEPRPRLASAAPAAPAASPCARDALTGLEARPGFLAHAEALLIAHPRTRYVLVCADVERFAAYNARHGREAGDELLSYLGASLAQALPPRSVAGRVGADRFAVLAPRSLLEEAALAEALSRGPAGARCAVRMGTCEAGPGSSAPGPADALERALLALRAAKSERRGPRVRRFSPAMLEEALLYQDALEGLDAAMASDDLRPAFQPVFECPSGRLAGAEALSRWGAPGPGAYVPLLEEAGLAPAHDLHIVSLALDCLRAWIDADLPVVPVSANLARSTLLDPLLARRLEALLRERRLPACLLHLEVSEEAWRLDPDQLRCALMRLQAAGFSVAVDDFGTASTSLSALEGAPVDVVKLDASLLRADPGCGAVVVGAAVRLVHELGMVVVAEGVEDASQARFLEEAGADLLQGYLCSPPLDAEAFEGLLRDGGGLSAPSASSGGAPNRHDPQECGNG